MKAVIFDWSGTIIDFGSLAPVKVFSELFVAHGVALTDAEVRAPMGMLKRDHIRALLGMERIAIAWQRAHGAPANEQTIDALNAELEQRMPQVAAHYATPIPGAIEALQRLRDRSIRIGSTTGYYIVGEYYKLNKMEGKDPSFSSSIWLSSRFNLNTLWYSPTISGYTRETMNAVQPAARERGVEVEALYTSSSSDVPAGRPSPWMIYRNCIDLDVYPPSAVVKVGDTLQDIYEGLNAGAWTVGVVVGSSLLGLSSEEFARLNAFERGRRLDEVRKAFFLAGAHYVIDSLDELDTSITAIDMRQS